MQSRTFLGQFIGLVTLIGTLSGPAYLSLSVGGLVANHSGLTEYLGCGIKPTVQRHCLVFVPGHLTQLAYNRASDRSKELTDEQTQVKNISIFYFMILFVLLVNFQSDLNKARDKASKF
jgi:hypothetical protein